MRNHCGYSNFSKSLEIYSSNCLHPRSCFRNEIIWKEDYQNSSKNLTSIFMKFVIISKKRQDLITSCLWRCQILLKFQFQDHQKPRNEVGSVNMAEHLLGFEPGAFQFIFNALIHWPTLSELGFLRWFNLY